MSDYKTFMIILTISNLISPDWVTSTHLPAPLLNILYATALFFSINSLIEFIQGESLVDVNGMNSNNL